MENKIQDEIFVGERISLSLKQVQHTEFHFIGGKGITPFGSKHSVRLLGDGNFRLNGSQQKIAITHWLKPCTKIGELIEALENKLTKINSCFPDTEDAATVKDVKIKLIKEIIADLKSITE